MFDLSVAWRIYPLISKTPLVYNDSKFKLVSISIRSFLESVKGLKISYHFILDNCDDSYKQLILSLLSNEKTKLSPSEKKLLGEGREGLLVIGHFFESIESMRSESTSVLERPHETTSLRETVVRIVDSRRAAFLKKITGVKQL